jgi:Glycosyl transferase 4-like domain
MPGLLQAPAARAHAVGQKSLLMIAYHFPPLAGSSGIQRTLRFVQQLPALGWQPMVLTTTTGAYERIDDELSTDVPAGTLVRRAWALDTARHLSIGGRYPGAWARPDRWSSWKWDAVRQGMKLIQQFKPSAIWSTYPIATAHVIGAELQRRSGLPWIADFRDPMAQDGYPADPKTWHQFEAIESLAAHRAALCTFASPGATQEYITRYPFAAARMRTLENGYDEDTFAKAEGRLTTRMPLIAGRMTLLHSGIVYPSAEGHRFGRGDDGALSCGRARHAVARARDTV